ncbi:MAG: hypothetical protein Ct9H90mP6_01860 [Gammaproteobacteria bacterium]|nr:MAG: hypothetical protein Ct9H90mP6_01860 [Gammaproteobacteria bacterium]
MGQVDYYWEKFEETVEEKLINPKFVTEYPVEVSPFQEETLTTPILQIDFNYLLVEKSLQMVFVSLMIQRSGLRFEGRRCKDSGDKEAMDFDKGYITAFGAWNAASSWSRGWNR